MTNFIGFFSPIPFASDLPWRDDALVGSVGEKKEE
jgi:hypothetical protein